ncbi:MAG: hypothetical protein PHH93_01740 [Prolixibacteraceae bacterium]|nr:hypothetical protein [Prolixibacteraceae bacterium]
MKRILQIFSLLGLLLTLIPPMLFFLGKISHDRQNLLMLIGMIVWFSTAIFWLGAKAKDSQ